MISTLEVRQRLIGGGGTTPGKFRIVRRALVLVLLVTGAVGSYSATVYTGATREIADRVGPLSTDATELYRSLADADATVAREFLSSGAEPATIRTRYVENIAGAEAILGRAAKQTGNDSVATDRIADISAQLPTYTGLVEQARANNRQGLPVGVAYLRAVSNLMQSTILPAAEQLQRGQAKRLDKEYERAGTVPVLALLLCVTSLVGLVWAQVVLFRRTKRVFNVGLLASTLAVFGALAWWIVASAYYHSYLENSQRHSQSVTDALGPAQIAALQARTNESLTLVARDGGATGEKNFSAQAQHLARDDGAGGALGAARMLASDDEGRMLVETALVETRVYLKAYEHVRQLDLDGRHTEAVAAAVGADAPSAAAFGKLDAALGEAVKYERAQFIDDLTRARSWLEGLLVGTALLALAAVLGAVWGIGQRLKEYP
ncbi:MAG: hypothetical protein ACRDTG_06515 [Pseudonocardiaceae bacterium]